MKGLFMVFLVTLIVFLMYKMFLVVITKLADKKYLNGQKKEAKFEFPISLGMHGTFICIWCMSMLSVSKEIELNNVQSYIGLCLIGVFFCDVVLLFVGCGSYIRITTQIVKKRKKN